MRVLRVIGGVDPLFGGPSASSVASCIAAQRAGVPTTVLFPAAPDAPAAERLRREGAEVLTFPLDTVFPRRARRLGVSPALARWLARDAGRFDLVHAHGAWTFTTAASLLAGRARGIATVLTPHETLTGFDVDRSPPAKRAVKRLLRAAYLRGFDLVVFASELERADSCDGRRQGRFAVIRHPVERPPAADAEPRVEGELRLGFLGRLDPKKNLDLLVRVLAGLPERVRLIVAGNGPPAAGAALRRLAAEYGVAGRVEWLGFLHEREKPGFFRAVDLLVLPSAYECFGMAAAEALAAGVPVLVSPQTGIAEVVRDHACGFVVPASTGELLSALAELVERPSLLRDRAARCGAAAAAELSLEAHGARLRCEYEGLLAGRAAPAARPVRGRAREAVR